MAERRFLARGDQDNTQGRLDAFLPAEIHDALYTTKAFQNDTDLLFGRILATGLPLDLPYNGIRRWLFLGTHAFLLA